MSEKYWVASGTCREGILSDWVEDGYVPRKLWAIGKTIHLPDRIALLKPILPKEVTVEYEEMPNPSGYDGTVSVGVISGKPRWVDNNPLTIHSLLGVIRGSNSNTDGYYNWRVDEFLLRCQLNLPQVHVTELNSLGVSGPMGYYLHTGGYPTAAFNKVAQGFQSVLLEAGHSRAPSLGALSLTYDQLRRFEERGSYCVHCNKHLPWSITIFPPTSVNDLPYVAYWSSTTKSTGVDCDCPDYGTCLVPTWNPVEIDGILVEASTALILKRMLEL